MQPAAGDAGTALGGALHVAAAAGEPVDADAGRRPRPRLDRRRDRGAAAHRPRPRTSAPPTWRARWRECLADDGVVAWFQGRSEYGPRALGHRSLLAHPGRSENLERLNDVKGREQFRPVAPMVLRRAGGGIFVAGRCPRRTCCSCTTCGPSGGTASRPSCTSTGPRGCRRWTRRRSRWWPGCSRPSSAAPGLPVRGQHQPQHGRAARWSTTRGRAGVLRLGPRRPARHRTVRRAPAAPGRGCRLVSRHTVVVPTVGRPSLGHLLRRPRTGTRTPPDAPVVLVDDRPGRTRPLDAAVDAGLAVTVRASGRRRGPAGPGTSAGGARARLG